uniref:Uncharacterized protein n=1 Tax=Acrobeloides nanus TaxID=290746 RepID=A0A914BZM0_9BILA
MAAITLIISTSANIATIFIYRFPPSDWNLAPMDPLMDVPKNLYTFLIYDAPWIRCQIFIIGMMTGYFLSKKSKLEIPKVEFYVVVSLYGRG